MPSSAVCDDRSRPAGRLAHLVEAVVVVLLIVQLVMQLLVSPPTYENDPDGYVTYATFLHDNHALMTSFPRLPGYPLFLAVLMQLSPAPLPDTVWAVQGFIMLVLAIVSWALARRWLGPLAAIVLLGVLAAPSFLVRMSVVMLSDMLYSVLVLPVLIAMGWWAFTAGSRRSWLWCIPFALGLIVTQAIRPTSFLFCLLLGPALVVGYLVERALRRRALRVGLPLVLTRAFAVLALGFVSFGVVDTFLDTGARAFGSQFFAYRVVLALPPASDTRADRRIEAAKARFEKVEGRPIETAHFSTYRTFNAAREFRDDDVQAVWKDRLMHAPGQYLLSILRDIGMNHYYLVMRFTPLFFDINRIFLFGERFMPSDGSISARIFDATGLVIFVYPTPTPISVTTELSLAVVRVITVWGLLILGCWQLARRWCALTIANVLLIAGFIVELAAINTIDGRYLMPFAMLIYLAQATGIAWIAQSLLRPGSMSALRASSSDDERRASPWVDPAASPAPG